MPNASEEAGSLQEHEAFPSVPGFCKFLPGERFHLTFVEGEQSFPVGVELLGDRFGLRFDASFLGVETVNEWAQDQDQLFLQRHMPKIRVGQDA